MSKEEIAEQVRQRKEELITSKRELEAKHVTGRWVTDSKALRRHPGTRHQEMRARRAPKQKAEASILLAEGRTGIELERGEVSDRVRQADILAGVDEQTSRKSFSLRLPQLGPYALDFTSNGSHVVLAGLRGHVASFDWKQFALQGETQLKDRCSDVKFLVDHTMIAVAQKRFVYMYTGEGVEMHVLPKMANITNLTYLPKHLLLCGTSTQFSLMQFTDISTGKEVAMKPPSLMRDPPSCVTTNPGNGVVTTGDTRGVVKMWAPTVADPLVQLKAHRGLVTHLAYHPGGRFLTTVGADRSMKIWDCRSLRPLEEYNISYRCDSIAVSQAGMLAVAGGTNVQIWKDIFTKQKQHAPYLKHTTGYANAIRQVVFCPYEDVLGIGHLNGFSTMIVPASGEPNPDIYAANPYERDGERKERVVTRLLDKLPPETISLDLQIANVDEDRLEKYMEKLAASRKAKNIREKKRRRAEARSGDDAVKGPTGLVGASKDLEDELDEELGVKEKGVTKKWRSRDEIVAEKKKKAWDKKDSTDKVRSKQTMRHSKQVQHSRKTNTYEANKRKDEMAAQDDDEDEEPRMKKPRKERGPRDENAAFARFA